MLLEKPIPFADSEKADIVIMFGARDSNAHIEEGIRSIVALLDNNDTMAKTADGPQPGGGCRITMNRHLTPVCKTAILINGIPASGEEHHYPFAGGDL